MRGFPYLIILAAAVLPALLLCPVRLEASANQTGFSARLTLRILLLFGLIRLPLRFLIQFDAERAKRDPIEAKKAFCFFKLTKNGELKPIKRRKPQKPKHRKLPLLPILNAVSVKKLALKGSIALEDAAACVLLCGALNCAVKPLLKLFAELSPMGARKAVIAAEFLPKFSEASVSMAFEGILETNSAKLIKGGFSAITQKMRGKAIRRRAQRPRFRKKPQKTFG